MHVSSVWTSDGRNFTVLTISILKCHHASLKSRLVEMRNAQNTSNRTGPIRERLKGGEAQLCRRLAIIARKEADQHELPVDNVLLAKQEYGLYQMQMCV